MARWHSTMEISSVAIDSFLPIISLFISVFGSIEQVEGLS